MQPPSITVTITAIIPVTNNKHYIHRNNNNTYALHAPDLHLVDCEQQQQQQQHNIHFMHPIYIWIVIVIVFVFMSSCVMTMIVMPMPYYQF